MLVTKSHSCLGSLYHTSRKNARDYHASLPSNCCGSTGPKLSMREYKDLYRKTRPET